MVCHCCLQTIASWDGAPAVAGFACVALWCSNLQGWVIVREWCYDSENCEKNEKPYWLTRWVTHSFCYTQSSMGISFKYVKLFGFFYLWSMCCLCSSVGLYAILPLLYKHITYNYSYYCCACKLELIINVHTHFYMQFLLILWEKLAFILIKNCKPWPQTSLRIELQKSCYWATSGEAVNLFELLILAVSEPFHTATRQRAALWLLFTHHYKGLTPSLCPL